MVFGGDATTWQYQKSFGKDKAESYDLQCHALTMRLRIQKGYPCISGSYILEDLVLADRMGHVSFMGMQSMTRFFVILTKWGMAGEEGMTQWMEKWWNRSRM